ncbi:MAG: DUF5719 family protein [Vicinamibacterales bacterium]
MTQRSGWLTLCAWWLAVAWFVPAARAAPVTLAWSANIEPDIAGYSINYRPQRSGEWTKIDVGLTTTFTFHGLPDGETFLFTVQAYTLGGLVSEPSDQVSVQTPGVPALDSNGDGLPDAVATRLAATADDDADGDGVRTLAEWHMGTNPTVPNTWHLAEGATGFFRERVALANPFEEPADVSLAFLRPAGAPVWRNYSVLPFGHLTVDVNAIAELSTTPVSAVITTRRGGLAAERTMTWRGPGGTGAHTARAVASPSTAWYFAEGSVGFFDTFFLIANDHPARASVTVTFLRDGQAAMTRSYRVEAHSRFTLYANEVAGLGNEGFATVITSSLPVTAERAMYFGAWQGGHDTAGTTSPATRWYLAEGRTGTFMDTYVLLANPNDDNAVVGASFMLPDGRVVRRTVTMRPRSRATLFLNEIPELADTDVAVTLVATRPIVVERSMYWPRGAWTESHNSVGTSALGTRWLLAEGEVGGPEGFATYVLVLNPDDSDAEVTFRFLREGGLPPIDVTRHVAARSRATLSAAEIDLASGERFGVLVQSSRPVAVERSMYWNVDGGFWTAGTNEIGIRLRE